MWKNFLKWLLKFALERLGEDVDAESKKQIEEYNRKREEVERRRVDGEKEIERIEQEQFALTTKRARNKLEIEVLEDEIKNHDEILRRLNDENDQKLSDIRDLSDDDVLRLDLPSASQTGTNSN